MRENKAVAGAETGGDDRPVISPWPVTVDELTYRTPVEADIPSLLAVRNLPEGTEGLIGYVVDPAERGRGIATATVPVLLRAAFEVLVLRLVAAGASLDNVASVRALERAGVRREQHEVKASGTPSSGGSMWSATRLLAEEWSVRSDLGPSLSGG